MDFLQSYDKWQLAKQLVLVLKLKSLKSFEMKLRKRRGQVINEKDRKKTELKQILNSMICVHQLPSEFFQQIVEASQNRNASKMRHKTEMRQKMIGKYLTG
jgi:hypothetical protein